ncbi:MAG TPA: ATP-binding protein [Terriglobia bacterium]|nr:ATP-binding protein [Terriglobia bacterium]
MRFTGPLLIVGAITLVFFRPIPIGATAAGFFYLAAIAGIAASWGFAESLAASLLALLCFDYFFLLPFRSFSITSSRSLEGFIAFLVSAIAVCLFAARPARRAPEESRPQLEMERLYALSRAILLMDAARPVAKQMAFQIAQIFELPAFALYDRESGEVIRAGPEDMPGIEDKLREAAVRGTLLQDGSARLIVTAIRLGGGPIGSMALRGGEISDGALHALSNVVAIGLERVRGQEAANEAEAARQSQELKSTLLDAIAHEFKTPLTSIKAAASALLASSAPKLLEQRELVSIIDEEADRLSRLVTEAIQMARVEGGKMQLSLGPHSAASLIRAALDSMQPAIEGREVRLRVAPGLPPVSADADLIALALRQLMDNALKYSPPGSPIVVSARAAEHGAIISVADSGQGITENQQRRIFEKFYRAPAEGEPVNGTGMGLTIARKIMDAHSGRIWVESKPGRGSEFFISIPAASQETLA